LIVKVKPYGFSKKRPFALRESGEVQLPEGSDLNALLKRVGIPEGMKVVVIVNGRHQPGTYLLQPGDDVTFFPPLEGG
jgi:molybdopterin synthase sulfur carrier subunit